MDFGAFTTAFQSGWLAEKGGFGKYTTDIEASSACRVDCRKKASVGVRWMSSEGVERIVPVPQLDERAALELRYGLWGRVVQALPFTHADNLALVRANY